MNPSTKLVTIIHSLPLTVARGRNKANGESGKVMKP